VPLSFSARFHVEAVPPRSGARVAVVDTGIHGGHPHVHRLAGGVGIDQAGRTHDDFGDTLGHGTAVAAAIREKAPGAELYSVKVFDRALVTTAAALAAAIRWAGRSGMHLVNLSLGTANPAHAEVLSAAVRETASSLLIVAVGEQDGTTWLPGSLDLAPVVPVILDWSSPRDECVAVVDDRGRVTIHASGWPRPLPGVPAERNLNGMSLAVANATGFIARLTGDDEDPASALRAFVRSQSGSRAPF
jgi:subtilisin family serine protease